MKVILSRKGMDASSGGIPSPVIWSDKGYWKFYSLPIPRKDPDIQYSDLTLYDDFTLADFISDVAPHKYIPEYCHLDPDVRESCLKDRPPGWRRAFGQVGSAQSHLESFAVGKGDVFLFFGWFKRAEYKEGKFRYVKDKNYPNGFHAIYSYLQVDEIYKPNLEETPEWLQYHPHVKFRNSSVYKYPNNTVYVSADFFDYPEDFKKNGSVSFVFRDDLILTKAGQSNRSLWELPLHLHPENGIKLSYNPASRWRKEDQKAILQSAGRGQEFVFTDSGNAVENWCIDLIKYHQVTD